MQMENAPTSAKNELPELTSDLFLCQLETSARIVDTPLMDDLRISAILLSSVFQSS